MDGHLFRKQLCKNEEFHRYNLQFKVELVDVVKLVELDYEGSLVELDYEGALVEHVLMFVLQE